MSNWNAGRRYARIVLFFTLTSVTQTPRQGKGSSRGLEVSPPDQFPSLPASARVAEQADPRSAYVAYNESRYSGFSPAVPQMRLAVASMPSVSPRDDTGGKVWSSAPQARSGPAANNSSGSVGKDKEWISPVDSPRSFHEKMRVFTGIGSEAYRSGFGLPEDRGIAWEMHCMRERLLATSRDSVPPTRVPELVQHKYHSLLLLDAPDQGELSHVLGYKTCAYKALSTVDPFAYCLRRVDGFRLSNFDLVQDAIERWSEIKHPNIVSVRQAFATSEFQDVEGVGEGGSLVYVYDYIDLAQTLQAWHESTECKPVHETVLWDVITQTCLALRLVHSRNLAARCLHPSKLIVSSRFRIHLNCLGLLDAIQHQSLWSEVRPAAASVAEQQKRDLSSLAKIVLCLGLGKKWEDVSLLGFPELVEQARSFSIPNSVLRVVEELLSERGSAESVIALSGSFIAYKAEQLESTQDVLVSELRKFLDVSRMHKMLVKVSAISDRAHLLEDWRWASTGDRYIVQLFRDYIFYQNDEAGRPFLDFGHVCDCLAKVDVGSLEPIMLMNRDGSSVLVTTYNDIRRCIETSFKEIADASMIRAPPPPGQVRPPTGPWSL